VIGNLSDNAKEIIEFHDKVEKIFSSVKGLTLKSLEFMNLQIDENLKKTGHLEMFIRPYFQNVIDEIQKSKTKLEEWGNASEEELKEDPKANDDSKKFDRILYNLAKSAAEKIDAWLK